MGAALEQVRDGVEHRGLLYARRCRGLRLSKRFLLQREMPQFDANDRNGSDYRERSQRCQEAASRGIFQVTTDSQPLLCSFNLHTPGTRRIIAYTQYEYYVLSVFRTVQSFDSSSREKRPFINLTPLP